MDYAQVMTFFKGPTKTAKRLGISRQAVDRWKKNGIKRSRQLHIQAVSRGKLKADPK